MEFLLQLLFAMVVLFILARFGSVIVSRFGLPGLIGEIMIGIVIANLTFGDWSLMSTLGLELPPAGSHADAGSDLYMVIYAFAELGVIFLLFTVGLETKVKDLTQIVLEMLASLNAMNKKKERLIEITADGRVEKDEIDDFIFIQQELERISITVETLQLWVEQMLVDEKINLEKYREITGKSNP